MAWGCRGNGRSPRILVLGTGAVGGYIAAYLAEAGWDLCVSDPWVAHIQAMKKYGISVEEVDGSRVISTKSQVFELSELMVRERDKAYEVIILACKAYSNSRLAPMAAELLSPDGMILLAQNGINERDVAEVVGAERLLGVVVNKIVVELVEPGVIRRSITKGGAGFEVFNVGEVSGGITERAEWVRNLLNDVDTAKVTSRLFALRWSKLVQNCMSNPISTISGLSTRAYIEEEITRHLSILVAGESASIGYALGYELEAINGVSPKIWIEAAQALANGCPGDKGVKRAEEVLFSIAARMSYNARPSMAQDFLKGRDTEINYLNGRVVFEARRQGLECPFNSFIVDAVRGVVSKSFSPGLDVVRGITTAAAGV